MSEYRRGFKKEAEQIAQAERVELGLAPRDPLDPWQLASHHGVEVVSLSELRRQDDEARAAVSHFVSADSGAFSAMLLPVGLGACIVENDSHASTRRKANLSHELGHLFLDHEFGYAIFDGRCRDFDATAEREAVWLGGELLIPRVGALACARDDMSDADVAHLFGVSEALAAMRMNASGARLQASRRR